MTRERKNSIADQTQSLGPASFVIDGVSKKGYRTIASKCTNGRTHRWRVEHRN